MTVSYNPSVVTNGLVLAYDAANIKSYDPRENLLTYSEDSTSYNYIDNATVTTSTIASPYNLSTAHQLTSTLTGGNNNCFVQKVASVSIDTSTYVFSVFLKKGTSATTLLNLQLAGGTYQQSVVTITWSTATISAIGGTGDITDYGNGWYRVSITLTNNGTNNSIYPRIYVTGQGTNNVSGHYVYIWGWQCEKGTTATNYIKTLATNNPRSILSRDLSGNVNTGTLGNGVTYSSDNKGGFVFDGVNQNITVPYSSIFNFNAEQTIIIWLKPTENDANRRNPYNQAYGGGGTITHETNGTYTYFWGTAGTNTTPYTGFGSTFTVVQNEISQIAITRNASSVSWYKNGVFSNSTSNPYGTGVVTGTNSILIGSGYVFPHQGSIYSVYVYTKALTANQIKQNFNAFSGRFNL
jgi:hypothetical protein